MAVETGDDVGMETPPTTTALTTALLYCGEALWSLALQGTPYSERVYEWMTTLVVGCTAVEITTARSENDAERIGMVAQLPHTVFVPYEETEGGYHEEQTVIHTFDGREVTWSNCHWVRIPATREEWLEVRKVQ